MKSRIIIAKVLVCILFTGVLTGCFGIDVEQYGVIANVTPNLTGVYLVTAKISEGEVQSYAERNYLTDINSIAESMASEIADNLGWTFPYEVIPSTDGEYLILGLKVEFMDEDTFCAFFPEADSETQAKGDAAVGEENVYYCELSTYSTPYTEVYMFTDTIYPGSVPGKLTILLPGTIAKTNGSRDNAPPFGENGVSWSWNDQVPAVPMYLYTAGLTNFDLDINIQINANGDGDLIIKATAPLEVNTFASSLYPTDDPLQSLADRLAKGLNLSSYIANVKQAGSQVVISLEMSGLSPEEMEITLNKSGLMSEANINVNSNLIKGQYEFSGSLMPWESSIGYPESVALTINLPGQTNPQPFTADESIQPISIASESTNWLGILSIGMVCFLIIGGGAVLLGGGIFMLRRKKD